MSTTTEVKTRPILFSSPMVRAILAGKKTQTRREVKWNPATSGMPKTHLHDFSRAWVDPGFKYEDGVNRFQYLKVPFAHPEDGWEHEATERCYCPHGAPGDRLWVRETWCGHWGDTRDARERAERVVEDAGIKQNDGSYSQATKDNPVFVYYRATYGDKVPMSHLKWRPSILMPRWASRITLQINRIRVERLHDITEADARAEGVESRDAFRTLWTKINGEASWLASPFVWVIEFERVKP